MAAELLCTLALYMNYLQELVVEVLSDDIRFRMSVDAVLLHIVLLLCTEVPHLF